MMKFSVMIAMMASATLADYNKERPVSKVVSLLKNMQGELLEEQKADEEVYDKVQCWCETNTKEKNDAVKQAEKNIAELESTIESLAAKIGGLTAEIANLKKEIEDNRAALATATELREKEAAEFAAEEKELLGSIGALNDAIAVLSKHNAPEALVSVRTLLQKHLKGHNKVLSAFLQQPYQSYASQSGEVFGILKSMKETFETNLSAAQKEEQEAKDMYESLKAAKESQIAKAREQQVMKTEQLTAARVAAEEAKADIQDVRKSLSADELFLVDLGKQCSTTDEEWAERQKTRQGELQAISEAITILTDDSARDLFSSTLNFVQFNQEGATRQNVVQVLRAAAVKADSAQLSNLAMKATLDSFAKVKAAIDEMKAGLLQEAKEESEHRDWCNKELSATEKSTWAKKNSQEDLTNEIEQLESSIKTFAEQIEDENSKIASAKVELKRASENREAENHVFQQAVADQRATVALISKAADRLKAFYEAKPAAKAFLEKTPVKTVLVQSKQQPKAPAEFKKYAKKETSGVIVLLQTCINDANRLETDALKSEQQAQTMYENFVKDTSSDLTAMQRAVTEKTEAKATAEVRVSEAKAELAGVVTDLENLAKYSADTHGACDFVLKNYDLRQQAREEEMDALDTAKAILSGSTFAKE